MPESTAPAATGTITLNGETYTWSSPTLADLEHLEAVTKQSLTDIRTWNSIGNRILLIVACLKRHHPDITPGIVRHWPARTFVDCWPMLVQAIPFFQEPGPDNPSAASSSELSSGPSDGPPQSSEESA